jgi:hypothetical protein
MGVNGGLMTPVPHYLDVDMHGSLGMLGAWLARLQRCSGMEFALGNLGPHNPVVLLSAACILPTSVDTAILSSASVVCFNIVIV